ncbi:hypothetical protein MKX01_015392 [Papaver californicum]|nr:hypothetical protein MKX01_015392 [Papaver californicum]
MMGQQKKLCLQLMVGLHTMVGQQKKLGLYAKRAAFAATLKDEELVPAALTLISKMKECIGKYHSKPSQMLKMYEVINILTKKVFTIDIVSKTCTCVQWQLREFPCPHAVCALVKLRPNWALYCSKYYTVEYYKNTYVFSITPLGNSTDDFPKPQVDIIHPDLMRDPGRPCVNRKRSWTESDKQKKPRHCSRCGGFNHNKTTCQGGDVGSNPKKKGATTECQVDGESFVEKDVVSKRIRKKHATSTSTAGTTSSSKRTATTTSSSVVAGKNKKEKASRNIKLNQNFTAGSGSYVEVNFKQSFNTPETSSKRQKNAKVPYDV